MTGTREIAEKRVWCSPYASQDERVRAEHVGLRSPMGASEVASRRRPLVGLPRIRAVELSRAELGRSCHGRPAVSIKPRPLNGLVSLPFASVHCESKPYRVEAVYGLCQAADFHETFTRRPVGAGGEYSIRSDPVGPRWQ